MVVAGLVLVIVAVLLFLAGLFGGHGQTLTLDGGFFKVDMPPAALFLMGIVAMLILFIGLGAMRLGARRARAHRKDRKQVDVLSRKLDAANSEREDAIRNEDRPAKP